MGARVESTGLAVREGLVQTEQRPQDRVAAAEAKLRALVAEVNALDAELETLSATLDAFSRRHDQALGAAYAHLDRAEKLVRRLQRLQDEVRHLMELLLHPPPAAEPKRGRRRRGARPAARRVAVDTGEQGEDEFDDAFDDDSDEPAAADAEVDAAREDEARVLKRLLRRLARVLHPDLAQDEAERVRLTRLMAEVNAAYERGDRTALELLAEKVGAGEPVGELTEDERLAHLDKRIAAMSEAVRSLKLERDRLRATATFRLHQEAERFTREGRDYFEHARGELQLEEEHSVADAWARLGALHAAAAALGAERSKRMSSLTRAQGGKLRHFDPVLESPLVRKGVERLERKGASPQARELARELEAAIDAQPWMVAATLLAYFAELAQRPPDSLKGPDEWRERWDALRSQWTGTPPLERFLTTLPHHLELGLRHQRGAVHFGLQLRSLDLLAGVAIALERGPVAELARKVLFDLGPHGRCRACGHPGPKTHLLRTRGLDELHAVVCPSCFAVQKRYWMYARSEGLEALLPKALELGLVVEQVVRFGGATLAFQLVRAEREAFTAADLVARLRECYLEPYKVELPKDAVQLYRNGRRLKPSDPLPRGVVTARLAKRAGIKDREVVTTLRSRIERRFRPDAS